jgi:hypothetical protein
MGLSHECSVAKESRAMDDNLVSKKNAMTIVGPFWRQKPNIATTYQDWQWCNLWLNDTGELVAIEWLGW